MSRGGVNSGGIAGAPMRLRRGLFGVKPTDVERALAARDAEIDELRKEIAALWQTYAQHDRAIREALTRPVIEEASAAGDAPDPTAAKPSAAERRAGIEAQLSGLDDALAAIEQATQTLEKAYRPAGSNVPAEPDSASTPRGETAR